MKTTKKGTGKNAKRNVKETQEEGEVLEQFQLKRCQHEGEPSRLVHGRQPTGRVCNLSQLHLKYILSYDL